MVKNSLFSPVIFLFVVNTGLVFAAMPTQNALENNPTMHHELTVPDASSAAESAVISSERIPRPIASGIVIPEVARGNEESYLRFLCCKLVYQPSRESRKIYMPIMALGNPLGDRFDLSQCGETSKVLTISTGYRQNPPTKTNTLEIWFAPRFLIASNITTTAGHFSDIMPNWSPDIPVGIFWTPGWFDNLGWYQYLTNKTLAEINSKDLDDHQDDAVKTPVNQQEALAAGFDDSVERCYQDAAYLSSHFRIEP